MGKPRSTLGRKSEHFSSSLFSLRSLPLRESFLQIFMEGNLIFEFENRRYDSRSRPVSAVAGGVLQVISGGLGTPRALLSSLPDGRLAQMEWE